MIRHAVPGLRAAIRILVLLLLVSAIQPSIAFAQGPPPVVREAISSVIQTLESEGDAPLERFAQERLAASYRDGFAPGDLMAHLRSLREMAAGSTGDVGVEREDAGLVLILSGARDLQILVDLDEESGKIRRIELLGESESGSGRRGALIRRERALEGLVDGPEGYESFATEHLTEQLRTRLGESGLRDLLDQISTGFARASAIGLTGGPEGNRIELRGGALMDVHFALEDEEPFRIASLRVDTDVDPEGSDDPELPPFTWENLDQSLSQAAERGFAGTVLAIHDGRVVVDDSWGMADREAGRPNDSGTIYDIGSVPFDFTRGAIYLLLERGQIGLDDSISEFLPDVPEDKRAITIEHLLTGRSGLPNFHGRPSDSDGDLFWIDREEAERRLMERPLLFEPGSDRSVSHSAFGLLSAIVERVSGTPYVDFLRENFFRPAGMDHTGFYGEYLGHGPEAFAVGYDQVASDPNIPPEWGPASWLVIGSGGMVSNPADLHRWFEYMRTSGVLTGRWLEGYLDRAAVTGGSDRGFMALHAWDGEDSMVFLASNSAGPDGLTRAVLRRLRDLATGGGSD